MADQVANTGCEDVMIDPAIEESAVVATNSDQSLGSKWCSPWEETSYQFKKRVKDLGDDYWVAFTRIRDGLRVCGQGHDLARSLAANVFPPGAGPDFEVPDVRVSIADAVRHSTLSQADFMYGVGDEFSDHAMSAFHDLRDGQKLVEEDADWAMSNGRLPRVDVRKAPSKRALELWSLIRQNPEKFHQVYGQRLMGERKDDAQKERERKLHSDKIEASEFAKMYRELQHLSIEAVMDGKEMPRETAVV